MSGGDADKEEIDERFQVIESKVLYQERTLDELNEVVTKQQNQIDRLTSQIERLRHAVEATHEDGVDGGEEPPPPHY